MNFNSILELQNRVGDIGADGQRVQEFVQSIHPSQPIQRNDFSNIGIPPQGNDNWDNISVTSVSTHAVPYTQVFILFLFLMLCYTSIFCMTYLK